jgi:putative endonuclease
MNRRKATGDRAEDIARRFLEQQGLVLLARNFRCRRGEIDLVMRDKDSLVFVEVRYRQQIRFGHAAETVSRSKQGRIILCARHYLHQARAWNEPARFDVVSIEGNPDEIHIDWLRDAFRLDG